MSRPQRVRKLAKKAEAVADTDELINQICDAKVAKKRKRTTLQPIPLEPQAARQLRKEDLPDYHPPLHLRKFASKPRIYPQTELEAFRLFITHEIIDILVQNTNSYAENARQQMPEFRDARRWIPTTTTQIWVYIGILFYMGLHHEPLRDHYWSNTHRLGRWMGKNRFGQLHRYFTIRDTTISPRRNDEGFWWHLEPVASMIRLACHQSWELSSHLTIDEAIIPFRGNSSHTVKMKNKPIQEGFKNWVLADHGYIWYWLWYSIKDGTEGIPKRGELVDLPGDHEQIHLATTFATVIRLAQQLPDNSRVYCLFLDNLFINVNVCEALLALNVVTMGTTRKNAIGVPERLKALRKQNQTMVWNSTSAEIIEDTECFVWQDNNAVLGMTTAYSIKETTPRLRKRPALKSTNARIVRPVFGDCVNKWLEIPTAIDEYNHGMNSVDRANQIRQSYTVHRPQNYRVWRPEWYWLLDSAATNARFLLANSQEEDRGHRGHRKFRENLCTQLLQSIDSGSEQVADQVQPKPQAVTQWRPLQRKAYCNWCLSHKANATKKRKVLAEVQNGAFPRPRAFVPQTWAACDCHGTPLCRKSDCWTQYHSQIAQNGSILV